jgi:phage/conjugal plasmid C-4 type zinc finger TraR family protein
LDDIDRAQAIEEMQREQAIKANHKPSEAPEYDGSGNRICIECGTIIPPRRIDAINAVRCVDCQQALEQKQRVYA